MRRLSMHLDSGSLAPDCNVDLVQEPPVGGRLLGFDCDFLFFPGFDLNPSVHIVEPKTAIWIETNGLFDAAIGRGAQPGRQAAGPQYQGRK